MTSAALLLSALFRVCDRFVLEKFGFRVSCSKPSAIILLHIFPFEPLSESGAKPGFYPTRPSLGPSLRPRMHYGIALGGKVARLLTWLLPAILVL